MIKYVPLIHMQWYKAKLMRNITRRTKRSMLPKDALVTHGIVCYRCQNLSLTSVTFNLFCWNMTDLPCQFMSNSIIRMRHNRMLKVLESEPDSKDRTNWPKSFIFLFCWVIPIVWSLIIEGLSLICCGYHFLLLVVKFVAFNLHTRLHKLNTLVKIPATNLSIMSFTPKKKKKIFL